MKKASHTSKKPAGRARRSAGPFRLYYQVSNRIRTRILEGIWPEGVRLPTEKELAAEFMVSRPTIRRAKAALEEEGFIRNIKGSGCYVNDQKSWRALPPTVGNLNDIFFFGTKMSFKIHKFGLVSNRATIKKHLKNPQDRFVFQIKGVRWYQGEPISCVSYYLPFKFGSRIPLDSLDENPFIPQLEKLAGIQVKEGIQNISLGRADAETAERLGLQEGDAVILVRTVYYDEEKNPLEFVETKYRKEIPYAIRVRRH